MGFLITTIATDLTTACAGDAKSAALAKLRNQIAKFLQNHTVAIRYANHPRNANGIKASELIHYRSIFFAGAGFPALHDDRSTGSNLIILGKVLFRAGMNRYR